MNGRGLSEKAYILLLIGGVLEIIVGITVIMAAAVYMMVESVSSSVYLGQIPFMPMMYGMVCIVTYLIWFFLWGILMIVSARWIKTGRPEMIHKGAVLGLISSILGLNIISLIGAILALMWKPEVG